MARQITDDAGRTWEAAPSGRVTQYDIDEMSIEFRLVDGSTDERRFARFSPRCAKIGESAFEETTDAALQSLLRTSQVAWTSPDGGYATPA
ncbi:MAG: hypothetical protein H0W15_05565 [Gemmatimonadales bacterium]|nr:hypothetical protein [Gemmatimonadales bacterium]